MAHRLCQLSFVLILLTATFLGAGCDVFSDGQEGGPGKLLGDGGYFGGRVALQGDRAVVNARYDGAGAVFVFELKAGAWTQQAKLRSDLGEESYHYAWSLAIGEERAAVGAIGEAQGPGGGNARPGQVLLYASRGGAWKQQAQFESNEAENQDGFGGAIAVHGSRLLIGAHRKEFEGSMTGAAYLYECNQNGCVEEAKLLPDDLAPLDFFGSAVALGEDRALVGAPSADETGEGSGTVYVFERAGAGWQQSAMLLPHEATVPSSGFQGRFGQDVALDDRYAVVSSSNDDVGGLATAGAAYVFERVSDGTWRQTARLVAPEPGRGDYFGRRVDISGDYIIVGADLADKGRGAAYIYHRQSGGTWKLQSRLQPEEAGRSHFFGKDVAIDGGFAVVGMPGEDKEKGAAYVYEREGEEWVRYGTQ